ncbi:MAG TPA: diphthine synthase [Candidatus Nanoarchaeia archaeon]|nr:diphthine synthase [Candidatus Nanoarchaeia archaeon]
MALYLIGLGLSDEKDITLRGLETVKKCSKVYLEHYTSLLQCSKEDLEKLTGKKIILADRTQMENKSDEIVADATKTDVALLVVGDPFAATTHINYILDCKKKNIPVHVIHNASVLTAVGEIGLELYKYGKVTSVPFGESKTPHDVIASNLKSDLHTLVLLDLDPQTSRFMTIAQAIDKLLKHGRLPKIVACARLGCADSEIMYGDVSALKKVDFGNAPYCLVVPAKLHFVEEEALGMWEI